ncbi:MAG: type II toxin-antitoxin system PemK/MazF family toxin [Bauldia sp.]|nr:type II toxin-antitoxin system PemK/MazF family toxin [Bauldia sp.]
MPLTFHPRQGTVLLCAYEPGFKEPEMVKRRPVVVVTPRLRSRDGLCTVVPLSTTEPRKVEAYHHKIVFDPPLPKPWNSPECWVKADMLATVAFHRLHLIGIGRGPHGKRKYLQLVIPRADLKAIQACILEALHLGHLTPSL